MAIGAAVTNVYWSLSRPGVLLGLKPVSFSGHVQSLFAPQHKRDAQDLLKLTWPISLSRSAWWLCVCVHFVID